MPPTAVEAEQVELPDQVWLAAVEAAEPVDLDDATAAWLERCVRAAVLEDRNERAGQGEDEH